jgi:hypothetical protein
MVDNLVHLWKHEMGALSASFFMLSSWTYLYGIIIPSLFRKVCFMKQHAIIGGKDEEIKDRSRYLSDDKNGAN